MRFLLRSVIVILSLCLILAGSAMGLVRWRSAAPYWLAYAAVDETGRQTIYRAPVEGGAAGRLARGVAPLWSPDGEWIVFRSGRFEGPDLYRVRINGRDWQRLTDSAAFDLSAQLAPDGLTLIWAGDLTGEYQIYRMAAAGGAPEALTHGDPAGNPQWSPDGRWIVFTQGAQFGQRAIIRVAPDGSDRVIVAQGENPQWSPDGQWLAFRCSDDLDDLCRIAMGPDGLPVGAPELWLRNIEEYAWSPDGHYLAVSVVQLPGAVPVGLRTALYRAPVAGGDLFKLTAGTTFDTQMTWSPDGRWLVFVRIQGQTAELVRVRADRRANAGAPFEVLDVPGKYPRDPAWSPPVGARFRAWVVIGAGVALAGIGIVGRRARLAR